MGQIFWRLCDGVACESLATSGHARSLFSAGHFRGRKRRRLVSNSEIAEERGESKPQGSGASLSTEPVVPLLPHASRSTPKEPI